MVKHSLENDNLNYQVNFKNYQNGKPPGPQINHETNWAVHSRRRVKATCMIKGVVCRVCGLPQALADYKSTNAATSIKPFNAGFRSGNYIYKSIEMIPNCILSVEK